MKILCIIQIVGFIAVQVWLTLALKLGNFEQVSLGIWNVWNQSRATNIFDKLVFYYGYDQLWLISQQLQIKEGLPMTMLSSAWGGLVSKYDLSVRKWIHASYEALENKTRGDKIFLMRGLLFMMTFSENQGKIIFHNLFYWNDRKRAWSKLIFIVDPNASIKSKSIIQHLKVNVPDPSGKVAFAAVSGYQESKGTEIAYSKLEIQFWGNFPAKAVLKSLAHQQGPGELLVLFIALQNDTLYNLIEHIDRDFDSTNFGDTAYTVDLKKNTVGSVPLFGSVPPKKFHADNMHQIGNEILSLGGTQLIEKETVAIIRDNYLLNLDTRRWEKFALNVSQKINLWNGAYDQKNKKFYVAGLKEGIYVARVTQ